MGKKKNKVSNNVDNDEKPVKNEDNEQKEKKNGPLVVVLKVEMDCEGCASKIVKLVRSFEGVESVKVDLDSNKVTVMGNVSPLKLKESLHNKTKKKVDLVSPQVKKEDSNDNKNALNDKKSSENKKPQSDNSAKKAPVITAVIKLSFHCQGCIEKIQKIVSKTKGVEDMSFDKTKETVTVKGTMDAKALVEALKERLKRPVEIVPPKKEKEGGDKDGEGGGGSGNGGGKGKKGGGGGGGGGKDNGDGEGGGHKMEMMPGYGLEPVYGYAPFYGNGFVGYPPPQHYQVHHQARVVYPEYGYGYGYVPGYPVHMKFNDENPEACSIM